MEKPTAEQWLPIPGHEGLYEVSDQGRVRSIPRFRMRKNGNPMTLQGKTLKPVADDKGYGYVYVSFADGHRRKRPVHQLVLAAFVGPMPDGQQVRHLDGDSSNNQLNNLAYGTFQDNADDMRRHGRLYWSSRTHCEWGHEYTAENTRTRMRNGFVERVCRECNKRRIREFYDRKRANDGNSKTKRHPQS